MNKGNKTEVTEQLYRYNRNVRICHWINVVAFCYLVVSGIHIFLDFPELYWGKVGFQGHDAVFKLSDWGISWDEAGAMGNRRWGRNYHFLFAWISVINGMIYVGWNLWNKYFHKNLFLGRNELSWQSLKTNFVDHVRLRVPEGTSVGRYSGLQKISYLIVIFILSPFMILSGLAQMPAFTAISPELIDLFGGRQTARTLHVVCMLWMILFLVVHVVEVFVAGAVNEIRSMITGKYLVPKEDAE